jgi:tubulysin polyketide synthase-like protein
LKAEAIIETVVKAGGELAVSGDRLRYRFPKGHPEKERILDELRVHKPEIIRLLSSHPRTCAPSCYEIEPGRWIHHPWDGCTTVKPEPQRRVEVECWH